MKYLSELFELKINYYADKANLGDALNPLIVQDLFGIRTQHTSISVANLMMIGSILQNAVCIKGDEHKYLNSCIQYQPIHIYGTGFIRTFDAPNRSFKRPVAIHALRGQLTQHLVETILDKKIDCVLGDAGLLASLLIDKQPKKYSLGIIPHYVDKKHPMISKIQNTVKNAIVIDVFAPVYDCLHLIDQCETVLSSSMHGCIIADAFGIPNQWFECSDKVVGSGFKFHDYYSSFDITGVEALDFRNAETAQIPTINQIIDNYRVQYSDVKLKQQQLLGCFPFKF